MTLEERLERIVATVRELGGAWVNGYQLKRVLGAELRLGHAHLNRHLRALVDAGRLERRPGDPSARAMYRRAHWYRVPA